MKELLGIKQLSANEIYEILDFAEDMKKLILKRKSVPFCGASA